MANTLRFKRGLASGLPTGVAGEPLFTTDTFDLYIGTSGGNQRFQKYIASGTTLQYLRGDGTLATFPTLTNGTVTSVGLSSATSGVTIGSSPITTSGTITLAIETASGSVNGLLSSTDWTTFNGKQNTLTNPITGTGASGQVAYWSGASTQSGSNNLFWDITNGRLGIGTNTPSAIFHTRISANAELIFKNTSQDNLYLSGTNATINIDSTGGGLFPGIFLKIAGTSYGQLTSNTSSTELISFQNTPIIFKHSSNEAARITATNRNFHIGTFTSDSGQRLQVTGDTLLKGSGATSATFALIVQNSSGTEYFSVRNEGLVSSALGYYFGAGGVISASASNHRNIRFSAGLVNLLGAYGSGIANSIYLFSYANSNNTDANTNSLFGIVHTFNPTSGTSGYIMAGLQPTINQTGGANGITRGLYINPTLTAAADWRSIEWSNNTGWGLYGLGTAANYLNGSVGIGTTTTSGGKLQITSTLGRTIYAQNTLSTGNVSGIVSESITTNTGFNAAFLANAANGAGGNYSFYGFAGNIYNAGNVLLGSLSDTGERLQVNGTMKVTGASTFGSTLSAVGTLNLQRSGSGADTTIQYKNEVATNRAKIIFGGTNEELGFYAGGGTVENLRIASTGITTFSNKIITAAGSDAIEVGTPTGNNYRSNIYLKGTDGSAGLVNTYFGVNVFSTTGILDISNTNGISIRAGGSERLTIASTGAATFSSSVNLSGTNGFAIGPLINRQRIQYGSDAATSFSLLTDANAFAGLYASSGVFSTSVQAATAIAIGTTPDTNKPFKILKNINATVGINFENTSTSANAFSAIQMGTDVTGGTKFTNLVYASSGVTANGVYNPDGTSLINNGGGGLNFLGTPTRFYTGGSNGVLRLMLDNEGTTQYNATAPTTNATDGYKQYSADVVAGNAAPHFRTENGGIIKLYQETTAVGNSTISVGGGSAVLDDTQFDGYTLRQIVKALRNQGILA